MQRSVKTLIILAIFAAIYSLLPYTFGVVAQNNMTRFLKNENDTLGDVLGIHLSFAQYNRGWFSSTATIQIEKKAKNGDREILKTIPVLIQHGPSFFFQGRFRTGFGMISAKDIILGENAPYKIAFHENIGFSGEHGAVAIVSQSANTAGADQFGLNGLTLHTRSNLAADQLTFNLVGDGLYYKDPAKAFSFHVSHLASSLHAHYLGDRHWDLLFSVGLGNNQLSAQLASDNTLPMTVNADQLDLTNLHFDTKNIAKLLSEFIELKQADASQQQAKPAAWMALFQQLLVDVIHTDTGVNLRGLAVTTPMGQLNLSYSASFPTLPNNHDYFDIATRNTGTFELVVPHWSYTTEKNRQFVLNAFQYHDFDNTVFSRHSKITLDALNVTDTTMQNNVPAFSVNGFLYQGNSQGDMHSLSQAMNWKISKICITGDCVHAVQGELNVSHLNFAAFRGIAAATQKLVQYNSQAADATIGARWMDVGNAYAKLILPDSAVSLTNNFITSQGPIQLKGQVSWPGVDLQQNASLPFPELIQKTTYTLQAIFPAAYVDAFIEKQKTMHAIVAPAVEQKPTMPLAAPAANAAPSKEDAFKNQVAQFLQYAINQGYLKKTGASYQVDLMGVGNAAKINSVPWKMPE